MNNRRKVVRLLYALHAAVWLEVGIGLLQIGIWLLKFGIGLVNHGLLLLETAVRLLDCWKILLLHV